MQTDILTLVKLCQSKCIMLLNAIALLVPKDDTSIPVFLSLRYGIYLSESGTFISSSSSDKKESNSRLFERSKISICKTGKLSPEKREKISSQLLQQRWHKILCRPCKFLLPKRQFRPRYSKLRQ